MAEIRFDVKHVTVAGLLLAAGLLAFGATKKAGGTDLPASPYTEALVHVADLKAIPYLTRGGLDELVTKHRYPDRCGGELSTVIHYGFSRMAVPAAQDTNWITAPPSEVTI